MEKDDASDVSTSLLNHNGAPTLQGRGASTWPSASTLQDTSSARKQRFNLNSQEKLCTTDVIVGEQCVPLLQADRFSTDDGPRFATLEHLSPWFPEADPSHPKSQTFRVWRSKRRIVLTGCSIIAVLVLIFNVAATVYCRTHFSPIGYLGQIYRGDCVKTHQLSLALHVVINVLSTALLAASNLCMQLLAAPTRREVNEAHGRYFWLDIGVPSFRNLWYISRRRKIAVVALAVSSVPLHFVYNSAIIPTIAVNTYAYTLVTPGFLEGGRWNISDTNHKAQIASQQQQRYWYLPEMLNSWHNLDPQLTIQSMQTLSTNDTHYARIGLRDCLVRYNDLLGNRSDLIMVTSKPAKDNDHLLFYGMSKAVAWDIGYPLCEWGKYFDCGRMTSKSSVQQEQIAQQWRIGGHKIDYCLSHQQSPEHLCSVEYSFAIMLIVCAFNLIKCICICYTTIYHADPDDPALSNIGDALCSFLKDPDPSTQRMSIVSKAQISADGEVWKSPVAQTYQDNQPRWMYAASWRRWLFCIGFALVTIIAGAILLGIGIAGLKNWEYPTDLPSLIRMGFGKVQPKSLVGFVPISPTAKALYLAVGFSNMWQFIISFLYFAYNAVLTAMLLANEWDRFGETRKTLRVTAPLGHQRSSYFISVPLKYGLPVLVLFGILHWTISQSVFVVYLTRFFSSGAEDLAQRSAASGYSCIAIITSILLGFLLLLYLTLTGVIGRYKNGTPLASTCSAAISAACHRPSEDTQAHMFHVQWGVVSEDPESNVGHCSFTTAKDVTGKEKRPRPGHQYD